MFFVETEGSLNGIIIHNWLTAASERPVREPPPLYKHAEAAYNQIWCWDMFTARKRSRFRWTLWYFACNRMKFLRLSWTEASSHNGWQNRSVQIRNQPSPQPRGLFPSTKFNPSCFWFDCAVNVQTEIRYQNTRKLCSLRIPGISEFPRMFQLPLIQHWMWPTL